MEPKDNQCDDCWLLTRNGYKDKKCSDHENVDLHERIQRLTALLREVEYYFAHGGQAKGDQADLWARISDELGPAAQAQEDCHGKD